MTARRNGQVVGAGERPPAARAAFGARTLRPSRPRPARYSPVSYTHLGDADGLGLKYLSVDCSVYLAEALIATKNYAQARDVLNRTLNQSEKLGLRALLVQSQYLLGLALKLSGNAKDAASHFAEARRGLDDIKKEAENESVVKRSDLAPIYTMGSN